MKRAFVVSQTWLDPGKLARWSRTLAREAGGRPCTGGEVCSTALLPFFSANLSIALKPPSHPRSKRPCVRLSQVSGAAGVVMASAEFEQQVPSSRQTTNFPGGDNVARDLRCTALCASCSARSD